MAGNHWNVGLNGNQLKLIAVISMLIDHCAIAFCTSYGTLYWIMRGVGRIAFPIYAYLLVEGFFHTRNLKKYALRLLLLAIVSEIPFDYLVLGSFVTFRLQNIFWTLLLGLCMMQSQKLIQIRYLGAAGRQIQLLLLVVFCAAAWALKTDYDYRGIMLIGLFFWFYGAQDQQTLFGCIWLILTQGTLRIPLLVGYGAAYLLLRYYNGMRGSWNGKGFFYAFYPVHLTVLGILKTLLQVCF